MKAGERERQRALEWGRGFNMTRSAGSLHVYTSKNVIGGTLGSVTPGTRNRAPFCAPRREAYNLCLPMTRRLRFSRCPSLPNRDAFVRERALAVGCSASCRKFRHAISPLANASWTTRRLRTPTFSVSERWVSRFPHSIERKEVCYSLTRCFDFLDKDQPVRCTPCATRRC